MITRLINIFLIIILGLAGYTPMLYSISVRFQVDECLTIWIDPVLIYNVGDLLPEYVLGYTNGDIILLAGEAEWNDERVIQHEYNHVIQYQALGDFYYITSIFLNLEGYPYYPDLKCNDYMWQPPENWFWKWGLVEIKIPLNRRQ